MNGTDIGKLLIIVGIGLICFCSIIIFLSKFTSFGHLPGDIFIKGEHGSFYFPVISCIVISLILSVLMNLFHH